MTHDLYQHLKKYPGNSDMIQASVEGQYGEPYPDNADRGIYIAGGIGIPGMYVE